MDQAQGLRNLIRATRRRLVQNGAAPQSGGTAGAPAVQTSSKPRLLAVTSGKGGVGKSNISVNVALRLAQLGYRTCLWDVDLGLGNVDILLGLSPEFDLSDVVFGNRTMAEIVVEGPAGLQIVPAGSGWYQLAELSQWRLKRLIEDLAFLEESADFIVIDTGAGVGRGVIQFALAVPEIILVTTPEPTALTDAYSLLKVIDGVNHGAHVHLVVNQVADGAEAEAVHRNMNDAAGRFLRREISFLAWLPRDDAVSDAVRRQTPFVLSHPRAAVTRAVDGMARRLAGHPQPVGRPSGLGTTLQKMVSLLRRR